MINSTLFTSFRSRILVSFLLALLPVLLFLSVMAEFIIIPAITTNTKQQLTNAAQLISNSVRTSSSVAIRNHLKAIAQKNLEIVHHHMGLVDQGILTRAEAVSRLKRILLSQKVGDSGYLYCLNSDGIITIHPNPGVENASLTSFSFIRTQLEKKEGYIEYDWKNPGEPIERAKALYMVYFEPLDWIISASSYRAEFNKLIDHEDLRQVVLSQQFGETGYAYIIDDEGKVLVHPKLGDFNVLQQDDLPNDFAREMLSQQSGIIEYLWRNPDESSTRKKIAAFESIPEYGWTIVASAYHSEIMRPVMVTRIMVHGSTLIFLAMAGLVSYFLSGRLTQPMSGILSQLDRNAKSKYHAPLPETDDEFGRLAREFNAFLTIVDSQNDQLRWEQERYRNLFDTSPDTILLIKGLEIIDCNSSTLALFGGLRSDLLHRSVIELSPPYQPSGNNSVSLADRILKQVKYEPLQTFEWLFMRLDGQTFHTEVRLKPFGEEHNEQLLVAFIRDITQQKLTEEALNQSEIKYRQLIENANDAIFIAQHNHIVFANRKTLELTGYSEEEIGSITLEQFIHPADRTMVIRRNQQRLLRYQDIPSTYNFRLIGKDNTEYTVQISSVAVDWQGDTATLNYLRDITEYKKLEIALQQSQKMQAIGTLAGGIAHDFNNLLTGILGHLSLLSSREDISNSQKEHCNAIGEYIGSATSLTQQLLGFARGGKYQPLPIDINELVTQAANMFARTRKELVLEITTFHSPLTVEVDKLQIEQVLLNLFVNSWQAMPGGGKLRITVDEADLTTNECEPHGIASGKYAQVKVTDTGIGMDKVTQQRIFDPFFTTKKQERGTGLGLASAYGIITNHDGFITVDSIRDKGTTFTFYLPVSHKSHTPKKDEHQQAIPGNETILFIDDEDMILEISQSMLEALGYNVLIAKGGKKGVEIFKQHRNEIDLILLDLIMPEMDGSQTFDALRALCSEVPVLLASGYAINKQVNQVMERGCSGFVNKPFDMVKISAAIRLALDTKKSSGA